MIAWLVAVTLIAANGPEHAGRLSASDLPAYLDALRAEDRGDAPHVGFRDLWEHDAEFRNRRVTVDGRIVRRFSQPAIGRFPALTEFWIVNNKGEPFCVVVPTDQGTGLDPASLVRFRATYLRPVRYEAVGGERVAPLLVAAKRPEEIREKRVVLDRFSGEWWIAAGLAGLAVVVLLLQFSRRPARRLRDLGTKPEFLRPGEEAERVDGN